MGNQHSASHGANKPRKNVHWKTAGRPAVPGKPEIIAGASDDEPNAITLRWGAAAHDGGAPLQGYQVECSRVGDAGTSGGGGWVRTAPPLVLRPELVLSGLEPPHRYQFRVAAVNAVGRSDYSALSDVLTVGPERTHDPPVFLLHLSDVTALENEKTEFRVTFTGAPAPSIAWFKDGYEIFSSRRTAITTDECSSVLLFHQTLSSDEGEIKCTATNRAGHAVSKAHLSLEASPKLRYPRQYEDGLLYEISETVFLKTSIVGKPTPTVEWRHDGQPIIQDERVEITNTPKFSVLKIHSARRSDRGEYQIHAANSIGEDTAAFLVTITAPPDPPRRVAVARQVDKSVTLDWEPPEDDGGCRIGNYVIEYYRTGWNVWLKATTSRKTNATLFDLIEGSEYRFRVKAESPYGMSSPSAESAPVRIPGRAVDMEFLAVESRIINDVLLREDGEDSHVSPVPRRKRSQPAATGPPAKASSLSPRAPPKKQHSGSSEFMLVLYPDAANNSAEDKTEKRKSFQLDLEDALSPPPISLSAPELSTRCTLPFKALRNAVSSTELLHERAMARFYKAVAMKEEQSAKDLQQSNNKIKQIDIPLQNNIDDRYKNHKPIQNYQIDDEMTTIVTAAKSSAILIKSDSIENREYKYSSRQTSQDSVATDSSKWQNTSYEEDYTASTVTTDEEFSDDNSLNGDKDRVVQYAHEEDTYNPRDKPIRPSPVKDFIEEEDEDSDRIVRQIPLPDPNFVPKPILKRRGSNSIEPKSQTESKSHAEAKSQLETKTGVEEKPKIAEKVSMFKKITKMPSPKPFAFPKLLQNKKEPEKPPVPNLQNESHCKPTANKVDKVEDLYNDEGRTVIDYYSNIVKEYGSQKRPTTPLYLNTEDLKTVAEKQQKEKIDSKKTNQEVKKRKPPVEKSSEIKIKATKKAQTTLPSAKHTKTKPVTASDKTKPEKKTKVIPQKIKENHDKPEKNVQQILLKKTERATIVIPIDYQQLEEKAKVNVRSAIDYAVDICLLMLAFWVYFFKDERLAIPFLILIIYRHIRDTLMFNVPDWFRRHTPNWLKKTS